MKQLRYISLYICLLCLLLSFVVRTNNKDAISTSRFETKSAYPESKFVDPFAQSKQSASNAQGSGAFPPDGPEVGSSASAGEISGWVLMLAFGYGVYLFGRKKKHKQLRDAK